LKPVEDLLADCGDDAVMSASVVYELKLAGDHFEFAGACHISPRDEARMVKDSDLLEI
jgi:hypothetical protein